MNSVFWNNDLAKAYDEKYSILEEARQEYDREVRALLKSVAAAARTGDLRPECEQIARAPQFIEDQPGSSGRCVLEHTVVLAGAETGLVVSTWFSSAWQNVPGFVYIAVLAQNLDAWRAGQLRAFAQTHDCARNREGVLHDGPMADPEGIYAEAVKLTETAVVEISAEVIQRFLVLAVDAAEHLKAARNFEMRIKELLLQTQQWLPTLPAVLSCSGYSTVIGDWEGQHYLQIWLAKGQPGFWLGYHAERGTLMFGHNPGPIPELEARMRAALREKLGCESFERYCNEPSGTILDRDALRTTKDSDILRTMREAFDVFISVMSQGTIASIDPGTSAS